VGSLFTAADLVLLFCLLFAALQAARGVVRQVIVLLTLAVIISWSVMSSSRAFAPAQSDLILRLNPGRLGALRSSPWQPKRCVVG